ncbi:MAG: DUF2761 domain-containing protein [Burkholderiaceae bacterium]|nr:MAG: DUF2761 domain-containing protein [Burkholderiaceae bacterium]TBR76862.1 MAG: DUF2761 domain-containing protein [Burkholderiaceae bacterium]
MKPYPAANEVGHVCPRTGRVAVLVSAYAASDLNGEVPAYWYSATDEEFGFDPWRLVDSVDSSLDGQSFDVWFPSGVCQPVSPTATLYLSAKNAAKLNEGATQCSSDTCT